MKMKLKNLIVRTRRTTESFDLSAAVTFLHGPIGKGKSTVARLIDYCFGGDLERTPAIQLEFVSTELSLTLGNHDCTLERGAEDNNFVRATWSGPNGNASSINAPLLAQVEKLLEDAEVYNLSDLVFYLCGITPIKVRKKARDPDSVLVRLSIRDIWAFCYLEQSHLDSSFYRFEDPFRGRKSQDAMRFFTGLYSEQLSQIENELMRALDDQRTKREAVVQIRNFMRRFQLGSETEILAQLKDAQEALTAAEKVRADLENSRAADIHPSDALREKLRGLSNAVATINQAIEETQISIQEQIALRAELITAKTKAKRADEADRVFEGVSYKRCPECGADISERTTPPDGCRLCCSPTSDANLNTSAELESLRRDFNERIDQIAISLKRREFELGKMQSKRIQLIEEKKILDKKLSQELARYDSSFIENIRTIDSEIAKLTERISSLNRLREMPAAIDSLELQAGQLQGTIDVLRSSAENERARLRDGDAKVAAIADEFKRIMLAIGFQVATFVIALIRGRLKLKQMEKKSKKTLRRRKKYEHETNL